MIAIVTVVVFDVILLALPNWRLVALLLLFYNTSVLITVVIIDLIAVVSGAMMLC